MAFVERAKPGRSRAMTRRSAASSSMRPYQCRLPSSPRPCTSKTGRALTGPAVITYTFPPKTGSSRSRAEYPGSPVMEGGSSSVGRAAFEAEEGLPPEQEASKTPTAINRNRLSHRAPLGGGPTQAESFVKGDGSSFDFIRHPCGTSPAAMVPGEDRCDRWFRRDHSR